MSTSVTEDVKTHLGSWERVFSGRQVRVGGANLEVYSYATYETGSQRDLVPQRAALRKEETPGRLLKGPQEEAGKPS